MKVRSTSRWSRSLWIPVADLGGRGHERRDDETEEGDECKCVHGEGLLLPFRLAKYVPGFIERNMVEPLRIVTSGRMGGYSSCRPLRGAWPP